MQTTNYVLYYHDQDIYIETQLISIQKSVSFCAKIGLTSYHFYIFILAFINQLVHLC